jgi:hypothetical protein
LVLGVGSRISEKIVGFYGFFGRIGCSGSRIIEEVACSRRSRRTSSSIGSIIGLASTGIGGIILIVVASKYAGRVLIATSSENIGICRGATGACVLGGLAGIIRGIVI